MEIGLSNHELGFRLVDCGDGALFAEGIRLTAKGGWIHVPLPRDPRWLPEHLPLQIRVGSVGGEPGVWVSTPVESLDLAAVRLAAVAALQSELKRRLVRAQSRLTSHRPRVSVL